MKSFTFLLPIILFSCVIISSCKKDSEQNSSTTTDLEKKIITDFADIVAFPNYQEIETKAMFLNQQAAILNTSTTAANLTIAQNSWRDLRSSWELCEAFIFGPVEDFNYDPALDTWPVNKTDLDSLLASNNGLTVADIEQLPSSLKGFHPIEYLLFGVGGNKMAGDFTSREKEYLLSLTASLLSTTTALRSSWDSGSPDDFKTQFKTAGEGSTRYEKRQDAFITLVSAMAGICDEVANGKMEVPFAAQDSTLEESQFSHNSTADFRNNIKGVEHVYLCKFNSDGTGLNDLVNSKHLALDNKIKNQLSAAINSFDAIDDNYGSAIYTQPVQILNVQNAINALKTTLETDLMNFVFINVKN
ncbi:hypothetical protein BH11BAC2_BH11BAC2_20210 [soil metagenome]